MTIIYLFMNTDVSFFLFLPYEKRDHFSQQNWLNSQRHYLSQTILLKKIFFKLKKKKKQKLPANHHSHSQEQNPENRKPVSGLHWHGSLTAVPVLKARKALAPFFTPEKILSKIDTSRPSFFAQFWDGEEHV